MDIASALGTYLEVVDSCAPGLVEGLYVVGSYALDDWHEDRSDIDVVVVTAEPATDDDAGALRTAHALLAEHQPTPFIDGPYVAWGDLITPPMGLHRPWVLEHRFHHDGDCFELNPVTWYVLATSGVTVRGPSVDRLGVYLDLDARVRFVVDNLTEYWKPIAAQIEQAVTDSGGERAFEPASLEWCALGPLRLHRTAFHGDVISKSGAAAYGREIVPTPLAEVLDLASSFRAGTSSVTEVPASTMLRAAELIRWCVAEAERASGRTPR